MLKKYWLEILCAIAVISATYLVPSVLTKNQTLGTSIPVTPALIDTYLASGIGSTDTSLSLASGTTRAGTSLSGTMCFVIDVNQPTVEYVCGTASSTSVTGLTRGIDPLNPNSSSTALAYSHRRFASVQVTDYPTIQFIQRQLTGQDGISNILKYASVSTSTIGSDPNNLASVEYVSDVSVTGCANGSTSVRGCVEIATTAESILGTATGGTGATLVPANSLISPTSTATTILPLTTTAGKLSQGFLDLASAFTFSGGLTSSGSFTASATTTLSGASTTISGDVLSTGNWTFSKIPTGSATNATSTNQLVTKNYVDTFAFNKAYEQADNSVSVNTTSTIMSVVTTASTSSILQTCTNRNRVNDASNAHTITLYKNNTAGESMTSATTEAWPAGASVHQLWTGLTAGTYSMSAKHTAAGGSTGIAIYCTAFVLPQSN